MVRGRKSSRSKSYFDADVRGPGTKEGGLVIEAASPDGAIVLELTADKDGNSCYRVSVMPVKGNGPRPRPLVGGRFKDA